MNAPIMNIDGCNTMDAIPLRNEVIPSCTELALDALPEVIHFMGCPPEMYLYPIYADIFTKILD
jgi:hypothetical protein